jgi:ParB-like chromosome segregation protein Spo0J
MFVSKLTPMASAGALTAVNSDLARGATKHPTLFLRDLVIEQRSVSTLKINPRNARTHSKRQVKAIADSIQAFGFTTPVLIDDDGMILAGHGRLQAAKLLGLDRVPAIRISALTDAQKRAFVLAENKLAERAGWDRELLALELGELSSLLPDLGLSVDLTGFEVGELDVILNDVDENKAASPDDDLILAPEEPVSRMGDLWLLGRHRLLCGDARDQTAIRRLLGDERVDLVFTDPPTTSGSTATRAEGESVGMPSLRWLRARCRRPSLSPSCGRCWAMRQPGRAMAPFITCAWIGATSASC